MSKVTDGHEMCAACLHSSRAHATVGKRTCENEGCACKAFVAQVGPVVVPEPEPFTQAEYDAVDALAEKLFVQAVTTLSSSLRSDTDGAARFAWAAAEAFVRSRRARPGRPASPRVERHGPKPGAR